MSKIEIKMKDNEEIDFLKMDVFTLALFCNFFLKKNSSFKMRASINLTL